MRRPAPVNICTKDELIRAFGGVDRYVWVKTLVMRLTGEWHEREAITRGTSMFAEDLVIEDGDGEETTVPNPHFDISEDDTVPNLRIVE